MEVELTGGLSARQRNWKPLSGYPARYDRPQRIVSLLPSATDLLFDLLTDLGLAGRVVGVSHSCDHPRARHLPVLTRSIVDSGAPQAEIDRAVSEAVREGRALYQVDGERLDRLKPDLVVTQGVCEVCAVTPGTLQDAVRYLPGCLPAANVLSLDGRSVQGILDDLRALAAAAGLPRLVRPSPGRRRPTGTPSGPFLTRRAS